MTGAPSENSVIAYPPKEGAPLNYWDQQTQENLREAKRQQMEAGPGADRDKPYKYKSPEFWLTQEQLRKFIGLMRKFIDGNIGGRHDGQEQVVEANDERS